MAKNTNNAAEETGGWMSDLWSWGSQKADEYIGVMIENERETPTTEIPYTADPNFMAVSTPAVQPTGQPLPTKSLFSNPWLWAVVALAVVVLVLLVGLAL